MKRCAGVAMLAAALSGCVSVEPGPQMSGPICQGSHGRQPGPPMVPGVQGPWGQGVPMAAPYASGGIRDPYTAAMMMSRSLPLNMVQMSGANPSGIVQAQATGPGGHGGMLSPPGVPFGPGMMPPGGPPPGAVAAVGAMGGGAQPPFTIGRTQVRFVRPSGMKVGWYGMGPDGKAGYITALEAPGRYNFVQASIYKLMLSNIEGRPGLVVYPTLEVVPTNAKNAAFLAHSAVPLEFTKEDFDQIAEGNYVVKVIYLPDPAFQEQVATGIDQIISTQLEPGVNPITEALRRGTILLVVRMGNVDQEAPHTPPLDAPPPGAPKMPPGMPMPPSGSGMPPMGPGMPPPGRMVPYMGPGAPMMPPTGPMPGPFGPGAGQPQAPSGGPAHGLQPPSNGPAIPVVPQPPASGLQSGGPSVPAARPSVFNTPPAPAQLATKEPVPPKQ